MTLQVLWSKEYFPIWPGISARITMLIPSACHQLQRHKTLWQKASEKPLLLANAEWKTLGNFLLMNSSFPFLGFISVTSSYSPARSMFTYSLFLLLIEPSPHLHILLDAWEIPQDTSDLPKHKLTNEIEMDALDFLEGGFSNLRVKLRAKRCLFLKKIPQVEDQDPFSRPMRIKQNWFSLLSSGSSFKLHHAQSTLWREYPCYHLKVYWSLYTSKYVKNVLYSIATTLKHALSLAIRWKVFSIKWRITSLMEVHVQRGEPLLKVKHRTFSKKA